MGAWKRWYQEAVLYTLGEETLSSRALTDSFEQFWICAMERFPDVMQRSPPRQVPLIPCPEPWRSFPMGRSEPWWYWMRYTLLQSLSRSKLHWRDAQRIGPAPRLLTTSPAATDAERRQTWEDTMQHRIRPSVEPHLESDCPDDLLAALTLTASILDEVYFDGTLGPLVRYPGTYQNVQGRSSLLMALQTGMFQTLEIQYHTVNLRREWERLKVQSTVHEVHDAAEHLASLLAHELVHIYIALCLPRLASAKSTSEHDARYLKIAKRLWGTRFNPQGRVCT